VRLGEGVSLEGDGGERGGDMAEREDMRGAKWTVMEEEELVFPTALSGFFGKGFEDSEAEEGGLRGGVMIERGTDGDNTERRAEE
jgi:hypothetical protein